MNLEPVQIKGLWGSGPLQLRNQGLKVMGSFLMCQPKMITTRFNPTLVLNVVCFENFSALSAVGANASGLEPSMQANEFDGIKAHFNATFEGPVGVAVQLSDGVLDPDKHTAVIFKENSHANSHELAEGRKERVV
ncbi:hypothetical protein ES332_D09G056800v1 [Gossypium tomentosum]|uniref:Uncharacterized protein n=1 Tax=Gossypium tomentosum TaxID=34277 RepID=A0A5D2JFS0_GOSTO|nr:hypothetical protein ES332_D09G056800v1 [Gossypium tomentosum]